MNTFIQTSAQLNQAQYPAHNFTERVLRLLDWPEEKFYLHQYEEYEAFLEKGFNEHPEWKDCFRFSRLFRCFWCRTWVDRNELLFLPMATDLKHSGFNVEEDYLFINSTEYLLKDPVFMNEYHRIAALIFNLNNVG